jgi:hypothetical protein
MCYVTTLCRNLGQCRSGAVSEMSCGTQAENRWAGACLLGVTCQECTRQRFLECYSLWFTKLLLPLKVRVRERMCMW